MSSALKNIIKEKKLKNISFETQFNIEFYIFNVYLTYIVNASDLSIYHNHHNCQQA